MRPEEIAELREKKYNATLVGLRRIHSDLAVMRIRPDFTIHPHKAGQYCVLGMGYWEPRHPGCQPEQLGPGDESKVARRSYSLSCPILDGDLRLAEYARAGWLEFYIVLVRETGKPQAPALTPRLFLLEEGARLYIGEKIAGSFTLDPVQPDDTVIFLGTGTGEAPHNYMTWELLRRGHRGKILSVCCVRYRRDVGYQATHEAVMERYPQYTYLSLTTREADSRDRKIYIQDLIATGRLEEVLGQPLDPRRAHVFLCGNPNMIGVPEKSRETGRLVYPEPVGVIELLEKRGFSCDQPQLKKKGNIHYEEYW